jgi:uncharacterized repeat protein (TIGR03803 family)
MYRERRSLFPLRWWSSLRQRSRPRAAPRPRSVRLRLEQLEDRITPTAPPLLTLASFSGDNGAYPGNPIVDSGGNLYGITYGGGASNYGTVFELAQGSGAITPLASFDNTSASPFGGLIRDGSGNLYGLTESGGSSGDGTVFELATGSSTITTLGSFDGTNGKNPVGGLIRDSSGDLYGTTSGTLFELAKGSNTITTLASLSGSPNGGLIMDGSGNLYGTTEYGGPDEDGSVFELAKGSSTITTLASFNRDNGFFPGAGLVIDGSGNLYGTTTTGTVVGDGGVFEVAKGSGAATLLASFNGADGSTPDANLILDGSGNLYGTTDYGGNYNQGTVFEVAKGSGTITTLASLQGALDTRSVVSSLIVDGNGNLYGTTLYGGASNKGTVFELQGVIPVTTDQWTGAGPDTNWSDGANWSTGAAPTASQTALFTNNSSVAGFTATVDAGFSNAIAGLDIDSSWGGAIDVDSSLTVNGNLTLASGAFGGSGAVTITGAASQWTGGALDVGSGGFTNSGTLTADTTGGPLEINGNGTFTNTGTLDEAGTNTLQLENGANLVNAAGATLDLTDNGNIGTGVGNTLTNAGTLEKTGGASTSAISTAFVNSGAITVQTGTLSLQSAGGTSTGGTFNVSQNATLDLTGGAAVFYKGSYTGTGAGTVALKNGILRVAKGGVTFNMGGSLFKWGAATIDVSNDNFTNKGTINYSGPGTFAILSGPNSMINKGTFVQTSTGTLELENGAILNNAKGATYNIESDGGVSVAGEVPLINAGTLEKTKGTGTSTITASTLNNTGTVQVTSGTLDITATVEQASGGTLSGGTWTVTDSPAVSSTLDLTSAGSLTTIGASASVALSGPNATFTNLSGISAIDNGGSFTLSEGQSFATTGALSNNGSLTLTPGSALTVGGNFSQSSTASLAIQLGGTNSAPTFGQLVSTSGTVTLAGTLSVTSSVTPSAGSSFAVLENEGNSAIGGTFANLAEGATFAVNAAAVTMSFHITYVGNDGDGSNNVVIALAASTPPPPPAPSAPPPPVLSVPPLLAFFDSLFGGTETVNANGTETLTNSFFGIPLLVSTFGLSGQLVSVDLFGFLNITFLFA